MQRSCFFLAAVRTGAARLGGGGAHRTAAAVARGHSPWHPKKVSTPFLAIRSPFSSATALQAEDGDGKEESHLNGTGTARDQHWNRQYEAVKQDLQRQQQTNGDDDKQSDYRPKDGTLYRWLRQQKIQYERRQEGFISAMTDERLQKLLELGIDLQLNPRMSWKSHYDNLCDFLQRRQGQFPDEVPDLDPQDEFLVAWMARQRIAYGKQEDDSSLLTPERLEKLNKIGFTFKKQECNWEQRYQELQDFYKTHGHCLVPFQYEQNKQLARWVEVQRYNYRKFTKGEENTASMTQARMDRLNELEFVWDPKDAKWHMNYQEVEAYIQAHGNGIFPPRKNPLGRWLMYQTQNYDQWLEGKKTSLTQERKELLQKLGWLPNDEATRDV